jgi:phosphoribosyl 1,2-cyclic phosphodiesterase
LSSGTTKILIDNGLPMKTLAARLREIGETIEGLSGIVLSHAHTDHVSGVVRAVRHCISRGVALPVYVTEATNALIKWGDLERPPVRYFEAGKAFEVGDLRIQPWSVPHDCVDAVGFIVESNHAKIGVATDLGYIPDALRWTFRSIDALMIESNHDLAMLMAGPHPHNVKLRVSGELGHLSNGDTEEYLRGDLGRAVRHVMLAHLSRTCNDPAAVRERAQEALLRRGSNASLTIAAQDRRTEVVEL